MKEIRFEPFAEFEDVGASAEAAVSTPVYFGKVDSTRLVKATLDTTGSDFFGATLSVKLVDSANKSEFGDVEDGGFTDQTEPGAESITFALGADVHIGTQGDNYGKYLAVSYETDGGDFGGTTTIAGSVVLENVFVPDDRVTLKL